MSPFQSWSLRAYRGLLILYPDGLRREFGSEMLEAFAHDLSDECAARGIKGAIRVWRIALRETIRIGFPLWLEIPSVIVPVLSAAAALASQLPLLIVAIRRSTPMSLRLGDIATRDTLIALSIDAAVTTLTSFVAVYRWKRANLITLNIDPLNINRLDLG